MNALSQDGKTVTLHKFSGFDSVAKERGADDELALIVDVETTGLSPEHDRIIQIAIRPFYFDPESHEVTGIVKKMVFYQDPEVPIREEIIKLTGITDDMVQGEKIDWEWVRSALHRTKYIIAHNASFDRSFIENELKRAGLEYTDGPIWSCSLRQVDWHDICRPSHSLEVLCAWSGFFYDSHYADADVDALLHLIRKHNKLEELIRRSSLSDCRVFAVNSPRELNFMLKRRWYRWDPKVSMWWKGFENMGDAEEESNWLLENLKGAEPQIFEVEPKYRYSPD